ncbi:LPS-assembly protein LptD [Sulfurifustis variabilis]|uniref:LPS-assembly protein LptD n=1 Tax=Sulfurifustis variabilis TaxID=1675686 RepID=UPI00147592BE|nr:LPS-assembly protein LptD [Sulfurifustis variabilis]
MRAARLVLGALLGAAATSVLAQATAPDCPADRPTAPRPAAPPPSPDAPTHARADEMRSEGPDVSELVGDAEVERGGRRITGEHLRYDSANQRVSGSGDVTLTEPDGARFEVDEAELVLDRREGRTGPGTYRLPQDLGRGDAQEIEFAGPDRTVLSGVRFTTCPEGQDDWFLRSRTLELDTAEDIGTARHATLAFKGVPLFYLPYLSFPISDERKSGFLLPEIGYAGDLGLVIGAPYYFNLAPNYDATLTPRLFTDRGLQLQSEFRYLGHGLYGQLNADYLPSDDLTDTDRAFVRYTHNQMLAPRWGARLDLQRVSDEDYLSDFGNTLGLTSATHLPQIAEIAYGGPVWRFAARATDYQTVDRTLTVDPYARLPQLTLAGLLPAGPDDWFEPRFEGELVNFHRDSGVTGWRANAAPSLRMPLTRPYGFFTPQVGARYIGYSLEDAPEERPSVSAPFAALDTGLYFEREAAWGAAAYTHTLEPRLFYLYVPDRRQDDLPQFDTSLPDFTFANLFRTNRFLGGDRIGDANQLTAALTTRFIDERDGTERLRASIGRIYYFDELDVNVPPAVLEPDASDLAAEAVAWLVANWHARATVQWGTEDDAVRRSSYYLQYQPGRDRILNIGHRYIRDQVEQLDVSTEWPLGGRWTLRARSLYSLLDSQNVESYAGLEYNACCWAARIFLARRLTQSSDASGELTEQRNRILFELELSGLARLGAAPESPLAQGLFGFPMP